MKRSTGTACTLSQSISWKYRSFSLITTAVGMCGPQFFLKYCSSYIALEISCMIDEEFFWGYLIFIEQYFYFIFCLVFAARDLLKYIFLKFCQHFDLCKIFYGKLIGNFYLIRVNRQNSGFSKITFLLTPKVKIPGPSCVMY